MRKLFPEFNNKKVSICQPNETDEPKHRRVARDALTSHRNASKLV